MRPINQQAAAVLAHLIAGLETPGTARKFDNGAGYLPVSVECIGRAMFSVAHYGEQNGDLMADPEMTFWRDTDGRFYPCSYRNDYIGVNRQGLLFTDPAINRPTAIRRREQAGEASFAGTWMRNIKHQQGLGR